ncbi:MAG: hypothetical protein E6R03_13765 [Hyphomicrobiaceae bacterium]|nr:MAG: hypothetical protein E6R03_13765 [Hyphomicrobiaceae bacterium]
MRHACHSPPRVVKRAIKYAPDVARWRELDRLATQLGHRGIGALVDEAVTLALPKLIRQAAKATGRKRTT